jgi:tagatose-1,6-bisphosphate aldolase non-catalytic subunit AgaZ/GatZ
MKQNKKKREKKANQETTTNVYLDTMINRHPAGWHHHWNTRIIKQREYSLCPRIRTYLSERSYAIITVIWHLC